MKLIELLLKDFKLMLNSLYIKSKRIIGNQDLNRTIRELLQRACVKDINDIISIRLNI